MSDLYDNFARVYDIFTSDVDYSRLARFVINGLSAACFPIDRACGINILDLGCGTGSLDIILAMQGYNVTAVDISSEMLSVAEQKRIETGMELSNLHFICQDMRRLNVGSTKYNVVLCMLDGFNYILSLSELKKVFIEIYKSMTSPGILIFDINTRYKYEKILNGNVFCDIRDDSAVFWNAEYNEVNGICVYDISFFMRENNRNLYRRYDERHRQKAYKIEEIMEVINSAGFSCESILDWDNEKEIKHNSSKALFAVSKI